MQHIHTTPEAVSKLRKQAKLLVRGGSSPILAQALDQVASSAGYHHWKHVTTCEAATAAQGLVGGVTLAQCIDPRFGKPPEQQLLFVRGQAGSGKSVFGIERALSWLQHGRPVHVLDLGRSFQPLCSAVGGRFVEFQPDGQRTEQAYGTAPLVVFECENVRHLGYRRPVNPSPEEHSAETPFVLPIHEISPQALLIVDEVWHMAQVLYPHSDLREVVQSHIERGGSAVLLSMGTNGDGTDEDICRGIKTGSNVRRTLVDLQRM